MRWFNSCFKERVVFCYKSVLLFNYINGSIPDQFCRTIIAMSYDYYCLSVFFPRIPIHFDLIAFGKRPDKFYINLASLLLMFKAISCVVSYCNLSEDYLLPYFYLDRLLILGYYRLIFFYDGYSYPCGYLEDVTDHHHITRLSCP